MRTSGLRQLGLLLIAVPIGWASGCSSTGSVGTATSAAIGDGVDMMGPPPFDMGSPPPPADIGSPPPADMAMPPPPDLCTPPPPPVGSTTVHVTYQNSNPDNDADPSSTTVTISNPTSS